MEKEEKGGCCEEKGGCGHCTYSCCHNWKKCHMMRRIIIIIAIIIAFCLGTQWGEMRGGVRGGDRFERGGMMNWGCDKLNNNQTKAPLNTSGTVTVDVNEAPLTSTPTQ